MKKEYDLVVLGGGTGGYVAAIRATQLGMKTAIVEHQEVGGTCLHRGCIPTKALLKSAEKWRDLQNAAQFGLDAGQVGFDYTKIIARKDEIVSTLYQGVQALLRKADVDIYNGYGRLLGPSIFSPIPGTVSVEYGQGIENTMIVSKNVLIATGSEPQSLPDFPFDGRTVLNSDDTINLEQLPSSMIIIGGGVIGIEWASLLIDYGVDVTVIEQAETLLPGEDQVVQEEIRKQLTDRGVTLKLNRTIDPLKIHKSELGVTVTLTESEEVTAEKMLISIGRKGNTDQIGLSNTDIAVHHSFIKTNEMYQTDESHIYAIGDCIGGMQLAHVASREGMIAVEHMAGYQPHTIDDLKIPSCIYSFPEAARIGLTEKDARHAGYQVKIGQMPLEAIGKAHVDGSRSGYMKIITDAETEDILGLHLVGDHATELISEASLAATLDATAWEIAQTVHPHPTIAEIFGETAMAVEQEQIHG